MALSSIEKWEAWIEWRLPESPKYEWSQRRDGSEFNEEMIRGMVAVDFAAASALLVEILVKMTHPTRLVKLRALVGGMSGSNKLAMLDRAIAVVSARDSGVKLQPQVRVLTAEEADADVRDSQVLMLFLHETADPNGLVALARVVQADSPGVGGDGESSTDRSSLYLALVQFRMFSQSVPPVPPALISQLS